MGTRRKTFSKKDRRKDGSYEEGGRRKLGKRFATLSGKNNQGMEAGRKELT